MTNQKYSFFGWPAVWKSYGWRSFFKDSIIPFIISVILCYLIAQKEPLEIYQHLLHLVGLGVSIVPAMVALILAAYTFILAFIMGDKIAEIKKKEEGQILIKNLNSSFAACLFVTTTSMVVLIIVSCISNLELKFDFSVGINLSAYFIISYLLFYSVIILFGVIIDVFDSGQTTLLN